MSDLDLGPDWIEVRVPEFAQMKPGDVIMAMTNNPDLPITVKRRVEPAPPLPRAPWSVIRGTMPSGASLVCILHENGQWWDSSGVAQRDVTRYVGGFEVLAEPRRVNGPVVAKAVLDRVREVFNDTRDGRTLSECLAHVAGEFGVTS